MSRYDAVLSFGQIRYAGHDQTLTTVELTEASDQGSIPYNRLQRTELSEAEAWACGEC